MTNDTNATQNANLDAIDAAIAKAKARKAEREAAKAAGASATDATTDAPAAKKERPAKAPKAPKEKPTDAEREAKRAQILADREARKAAKAAERDAKKAAKAADAAPRAAHMSKVSKAAEKLPKLDKSASDILHDAINSLDATQRAALALHLQHYNRATATEKAASTKLAVGDTVTIVGGDPKYVGQTGTVSKVQRIRCFVDVPGAKRPAYLFTSDVQVVTTVTVEDAPADEAAEPVAAE